MPIIGPSQQTYTQEIPPEWIAVEQAAKLLEEMCLGIGGPIGLNEIEEPCRGSTYAEDSEFGGDIAKHLHARACDLLLNALDQGRSFSRSFQHPPLALAGYSCARAALESCSTASWLVDSNDEVNAEERFKRYFDFTLKGPVSARRVLNRTQHQESLDIPAAEADSLFNSDVRKVLTQAATVGVEPRKYEGRPCRPVFSDNLSATELAGMYFSNGALNYSRFSAIAHCDSGTIENEWLVKADPHNHHKFLYQPKRAFILIWKVMTWFMQTHRRLLKYIGQDLRDIDDTKDFYLSKLKRLSEQVGFVPD